jgi:hypothetical protein
MFKNYIIVQVNLIYFIIFLIIKKIIFLKDKIGVT